MFSPPVHEQAFNLSQLGQKHADLFTCQWRPWIRSFSASPFLLSSLRIPLISMCSYKPVVMLILRPDLGMGACKEEYFEWHSKKNYWVNTCSAVTQVTTFNLSCKVGMPLIFFFQNNEYRKRLSSISNYLLDVDTNKKYVDVVTVLSAATIYADSRSASTLYAKYKKQCVIYENTCI